MKNEENKQIKNMTEMEFLEFERRQLQCKMGKMLEDNDYNSYGRLVKSYSEILYLKDKCSTKLTENTINNKTKVYLDSSLDKSCNIYIGDELIILKNTNFNEIVKYCKELFYKNNNIEFKLCINAVEKGLYDLLLSENLPVSELIIK